MSADGDTQSSAFQFEVTDGAPAVTPPSACEDLSLSAPAEDANPPENDTFLGLGRTTALAVLAGAVVVIVGAGVLTVRALRGTRTTEKGEAAV